MIGERKVIDLAHNVKRTCEQLEGTLVRLLFWARLERLGMILQSDKVTKVRHSFNRSFRAKLTSKIRLTDLRGDLRRFTVGEASAKDEAQLSEDPKCRGGSTSSGPSWFSPAATDVDRFISSSLSSLMTAPKMNNTPMLVVAGRSRVYAKI